jgi:hypothetical protein
MPKRCHSLLALMWLPLCATAGLPPGFVPITAQTQGVAEYYVTLAPTGTPGIYTPVFTPLALGSEFTSSLAGVSAYSPYSGCFIAGGLCATSNASDFSFVQVDFKNPIAGIGDGESGGGGVFPASFVGIFEAEGEPLGSVADPLGSDQPYGPAVILLGPPWITVVQIGAWPGAGAVTFSSIDYLARAREPGTLALFAAALSGLWWSRRRRTSAS